MHTQETFDLEGFVKAAPKSSRAMLGKWVETQSFNM